jgi:hypothetical protein
MLRDRLAEPARDEIESKVPIARLGVDDRCQQATVEG